jgi:hypothetical protein
MTCARCCGKMVQQLAGFFLDKPRIVCTRINVSRVYKYLRLRTRRVTSKRMAHSPNQPTQRSHLELTKDFLVENKFVPGAHRGGDGSFHRVTQGISPAHEHADATWGLELPVYVPARKNQQNGLNQRAYIRAHLNMLSKRGRPGLTDTPGAAIALAAVICSCLAPVQNKVIPRKPLVKSTAILALLRPDRETAVASADAKPALEGRIS